MNQAEQTEATRKLGGRRGSGLHPNVVGPMTQGLTPPPEEVEEAERVLAFWRKLDEDEQAEGALNGKTIDRYEAARAAELIQWAAACAEMDAAWTGDPPAFRPRRGHDGDGR